MKSVLTTPTRSRLALSIVAGVFVLLLVNALVAAVAAYGVMGAGFVWYCAALAVSSAAIATSHTARARLRVLLVFPVVSGYVYAFGVTLPDPDALWRVTGGSVGFAVMFFGPVAPAVYLAYLALCEQRSGAARARKLVVN
jgi:hypothetical protein